MKRLELVVPKLEDYWYEKRCLEDSETMSYNAGYDVSYYGYHYDNGCIDFPEERWKISFDRRVNENKYFAYLRDVTTGEFVGYVNYHYNNSDNRYDCGIVIESRYRGKGYSKEGLRLLVKEAFDNGVDALYDNFEKNRGNTLVLFESVGFKIFEETTWKKFGKDVDGVVVFINKEMFNSENDNL